MCVRVPIYYVKSKLKIKNTRQMNKKGLVIEVDSINNKEIIKAAKLEEIGMKVEEPRRIKPMIIIYDVEKDYSPEELKEELISKNIEDNTEENAEELSRKINFRYGFSTNNPNRRNWIVQMDSKIWKHLMAKGKVYINWKAHNIKEYINVIRCFKCHGYGHIAKACNQESLCEKCGEKDHMKTSCTKSTVICITVGDPEEGMTSMQSEAWIAQNIRDTSKFIKARLNGADNRTD